jgi:hypothetical protein
MRKIAILLVVFLLFTAAGCRGNSGADTENDTAAPAVNQQDNEAGSFT